MRFRIVAAVALAAAAVLPSLPAQAYEIPPPCAEYDLTHWTELLFCVNRLTKGAIQIITP